MKKLLTLTLALAVLVTFSGLTTAETSLKSTKSTSSDRVVADKASPKVMTGKVTQVNPTDKTFTIVSNKGKTITFSAAKLPALPKVGEIIDVTGTRTPDGPMATKVIKSSKSN